MAKTGCSVTRSRATAGVGFVGEVPDSIWDVLAEAWAKPFTLSSNYSRQHSVEVAFAASMGWISSITPDGKHFCNSWHVTLEGLTALKTTSKK